MTTLRKRASDQARAGSASVSLLEAVNIALTDAAPSVSYVIETAAITDLWVDFGSDKGATLTLTRLPVASDQTLLGGVSETITIADEGGVDDGVYYDLGCPAIKVTVTKTEAGTSAANFICVRGR